ncbi:MAG: PocR ligand-binding domain-containing protein [Candidatus Bathyarchaeota archaeon]|nr:PocR ligand-binding domain-containing protein [Candidatus Bathyarchaeota archaeon]
MAKKTAGISLGANENSSGDSQEKKTGKRTRNVILVLVVAATIAGLYSLSQYNYLLFHSIVEVYTIIIAFTIFAIAWNSRRIMDNNYMLFIGIAFLFVGSIDLLHTLTYKGMGVFPGISPNWATQLWLATRYMLSISFLAALLFVDRKVRPAVVFAGYTLVTALLLSSILYWQVFPTAYITDTGLTPFKIVSEYVISFILIGSIVFLWRKRGEFSGNIVKLMAAAAAVAVASELSFTLYTDVYAIANMVGHLLTVVSFYLIYKALIETCLTKPYDLLFHNLKKSEVSLANHAAELSKVNEKLEAEIAEREAMAEALRESEERLQMKLDSVLSPDVEIAEQELSNIIDLPALQSAMNDLYTVTKMAFALIDLKGKILVGNGWQDVCTQFHRVNAQTLKNCIESDVKLSSGVKQGEIRLYKCKNNMWDVVTPLFIGEKHVANVFFGQFFFKDEKVDRNLFAAQAEKYGFNKEEYLDAFDRVPRYSREEIKDLMTFYLKLSDMISKLSYSNLKLAKSLHNQKDLQEKLEEKAAEVEVYATHMEELAEERSRKLKEAERLATIGQTAGMVGHDIRNPLQAITSELYLAKDDVSSIAEGTTKENLKESINSIEKNVFYINKIVADLQDFARPLAPRKEAVYVEKVLKESFGMVAIPNNIEVTVSNKEELPMLTVDPIMLKRVLTNLIQNAVQAMPNGGKLAVNASQKNNLIRFTIEDTGEGISEENRDKVFTPLFTTKSKGQGFGLSVVKRLVEAQDGTIKFESGVEKGTKFILEFPL